MANDDFSNRLERILRTARPYGLKEVLFHYLPKDALEYLIDPNADISCANSLFQSDPAEIIAGVNLFAGWLENVVGYPKPHIKAIVEKIGALLKMSKDLFPAAPYIFCLTGEEDKSYFWCNFAQGGGYSVGLDSAKLTAAVNTICEREVKSGVKPHRIMYLMPTLYTKSNVDEITAYFWLLYEQGREAFDAYRAGPPSADCNGVLSQILIAASVIKDEKFAVEQEWRLVLVSTFADVPEAAKSLADAVKNHVSNPKPRLRTGIFRECKRNLHDIVRCIWISPQGDKVALHAKVQKQLGALLSPMTGNEIVKDGMPFVRESSLSESSLCESCPIRATCPKAKTTNDAPARARSGGDAKPRAEVRPTAGGRSGGGWNRPQGATPSVTKKKGGSKSLLAVLGLLVICAAACFLFLSGDKEKPEVKEVKRGRIKEVTPAPAPKAKPAEITIVTNKPTAKRAPQPKTNGRLPPKLYIPTEEEIAKARLGPDGKPRQMSIYKSALEQMLAQIFTVRLGDPAPICPQLPKLTSEKQLEKFFATTLEYDKDAPQEIKEDRIIMQQVKDELKQFIADGGQVQDFIDHYNDKLQAARNEWKDAQKMLLTMMRDGESEENIRMFHEKANELLAQKGIKPINLPPKLRNNTNTGTTPQGNTP